MLKFLLIFFYIIAVITAGAAEDEIKQLQQVDQQIGEMQTFLKSITFKEETLNDEAKAEWPKVQKLIKSSETGNTLNKKYEFSAKLRQAFDRFVHIQLSIGTKPEAATTTAAPATEAAPASTQSSTSQLPTTHKCSINNYFYGQVNQVN